VHATYKEFKAGALLAEVNPHQAGMAYRSLETVVARATIKNLSTSFEKFVSSVSMKFENWS